MNLADCVIDQSNLENMSYQQLLELRKSINLYKNAVDAQIKKKGGKEVEVTVEGDRGPIRFNLRENDTLRGIVKSYYQAIGIFQPKAEITQKGKSINVDTRAGDLEIGPYPLVLKLV